MFTFTPCKSPTATHWIERAQSHLQTLTPAQQRGWLDYWIGEVAEFPLSADVDAFDRSWVQCTLSQWRSAVQDAEVAA
jgi:hypothetical protein